MPHRDFISPRPVLSAVLHLVDVALPLPAYVADRLVPSFEVVAYSIVLAVLVFRRPPSRWSAPASVAVAATALANVHDFPLMSWYTMDGILLTGAGFVLLQRPGDGRRIAALVCLGAATATKQSFFAAPAIGLVLGVWRDRPLPPARRWGRAARDVVAASSVPLAYAAVVAAFGGWREMLLQLTSGRTELGQRMFVEFFPTAGQRRSLATTAVIASVLWSSRLAADRWGRHRPTGVRTLARVGTRIAFTLTVVHVTLAQHLQYNGEWAAKLFVLGLLVLGLQAALERSVDGALAGCVALAWMTALSWGAATPGLVSGSLALALVVAAWRGGPPLSPARRAPLLLASATAIAVLTGFVFVHVRRTVPYFDLALDKEPARLASVSAEFGPVRSSASTGVYLSTLASCVKRHPAAHVALLPAHAGLYPALHVRNPFPVDWMFPRDIVGSEERIVRVAADLDRAGDFLVLATTIDPVFVFLRHDLPLATGGSYPFGYGTELAARILATLHGRRIVCGPFVGVYRPPGNALS